MKIKCIALDLDGTVLDGRGELSQGNKEALEEAAARGIEVVVASGRSLHSLPEEITALLQIRYAITSNGAAVYDLKTGECLKKCYLTPESVERILRCTEGEPVVFEAFIDGKPYAQREYTEEPMRFGASSHAVSYIQRTRTPVEDMRAFLKEHETKLESIDIVVREKALKHQMWKMLENKVENVYITSSVPRLLEISHRDSGKEKAAGFLLEYLGLKREELAAFGDGDNDSALLEFAGVGIAMANASETCREKADRLTLSNDEDGVAVGIRRIFSSGFDFYERAGIVCRSIPYGKAATYGEIALLCGKPGNARQVGYALNKGRLGEDIPAHRVVNSKGILSGAAAFDTFDMQKMLLQGEGVKVERTEGGWKIDLKKYGWKTTLEDAKRFRQIFEEKGI